MTENRKVRLLCNIEKSLADLAFPYAVSLDLTMSSYIRSLIVKDLLAHDKLPDEVMESLV